MWDKGHPQSVVRVNTIHKIKSEINKETQLELQSLNLQDLMQLYISQNKSTSDPYIQSVGLPLRVIMFTKNQVRAIIEDKNIKIAHFDSTGAFVRRPYNCDQVYYYSIVCRLMELVMPAAEMITCQHDTPSISKFLKDFKFFVIRLHNNIWPLFKAIVVDWSWASMKSILFEWNEITIENYLKLTYEYVSEGKIPPNITILLSCNAYLLHTVSRQIEKKLCEFKDNKHIFLELFSLILLCKNLIELDAVYEELAQLLLTKDKIKANHSLKVLSGVKV